MTFHEPTQWQLKPYGDQLARASCHSPAGVEKWKGIKSKHTTKEKRIKCTYSNVLRIRVTHTMIPRLITSWSKTHYYFRGWMLLLLIDRMHWRKYGPYCRPYTHLQTWAKSGSLSVSLEAQCLGSRPTLLLWPEPFPSRLTPREAKGGRP